MEKIAKYDQCGVGQKSRENLQKLILGVGRFRKFVNVPTLIFFYDPTGQY